MSSGIYAALSGAVSKMQAVEVISSNLSNVNSNGFKKDRISFAAALDGATQVGKSAGINHTYIPESKTDFTQGTMETTKRDFDVAINGDGYFKVRRDTEIFYTRLGNFDRAIDGTLMTKGDNIVLNTENKPINIPDGPISIDEYGSILSAEGEVGRLAVYDPDETKLIKQGAGLFTYTGDEKAVPLNDKAQIVQGNLERSNVKTMEETILMMTSLRGFESYQKAMKNYYSIDARADDIGSL
ncbi:MAG: flagellar hook basal-body protein [Thermodesulfobacteriota bacterium]|nr:flagellar hook basal-body protein [Thermodesulfobacteriota bacterium]